MVTIKHILFRFLLYHSDLFTANYLQLNNH